MDILESLSRSEVLAILGAVIAGLLPRKVWEFIPVVRFILGLIDAATKSKQVEKKAEEIATISKVAEEVVKGTEQLIQSNQLTKEAAKAHATSFLISNFKLDAGTAELLVERAVSTLDK